ncbi:proteasome maturation factor UMP1 [Anaeromyces robustus]|uniref:Proteasome maturation factor UMP1 n=1 Tax=Anaeromyces robustus TaxID=1754192 RepID=A0A1Y1VRX3_9FUNG|nr:proteasome maturation factor UMP1 [Anaeromyces robustus]|eukprot:ORX64040.1 proteasome maturation factor UMP1 [Anaeromyces robustus]
MDSYRIVPKANEKSVTKSIAETSNKEYGVHDTFRYGPRRLVDEVLPPHPLQARLENWDETQNKLHMSMLRNSYGIHVPIRLQMEKAIVSQINRAPHQLHSEYNNLGLDILNGVDNTLAFEDFLGTDSIPTFK